MKIGDKCPFCEKGYLELVEKDFPWTIDHLQCPICDSTYNLDGEIKDEDGKK